MGPVRVAADVAVEVVDGEAVLLHLPSGRWYALNATGTRIWELLVATGDPEAVVAAMADEYDVDPDTLRRDVDALIRALRQAGLVVDGG